MLVIVPLHVRRVRNDALYKYTAILLYFTATEFTVEDQYSGK